MEAAAELFKLAATNGNEKAQYKMATFYEDGKGVEKDLRKAAEFFQMAADQGNSDAQLKLGEFYEKGFGLEKDPAMAKKLDHSACLQSTVW